MPQRTSPFGLTTTHLTEFGKQLLPHFSGVTSCDTIDHIFPHFDVTRSCIINLLEKQHKRGGHWVALFYDANKHCLYYWDPYGFPPTNAYILEFLTRAPAKVTCYDQRVQSLWSVYCGFFVMAFLIHKELNLSTKAFFHIFDEQHHHLNDDIAVLFIKAYIEQHCSQQLARLS